MHDEFECYYQKEKPERNRVRDKVWKKIETVDEVAKKTYELFESFQKKVRENDSNQDKRIEELKAMLQEIASGSALSDTEIRVIKEQVNKLNDLIIDIKTDLKETRKYIGNGWQKDIINEQMKQTYALLQSLGNYKIESGKEKEKRKTKIWIEVFKLVGMIVGTSLGAGGVVKLFLG